MNEHWAELLTNLPDYLGGHMLLSVAALAAGVFFSVPLGILASRRPRLGEALLAMAGIIQTVPSLALLVLMIPLLYGAIGFAPAFVALTLYSILPILVSVVIGIRGVNPTLIEAAQGLGMSGRQMLLCVQLPLALPVIIGGIRTAAVLVVGTATLATLIGGKSLGNYIFLGLEVNDMRATVVGCVLAAVLAVALDQLVRLLEVAAQRREPRLAWVAGAGLLLVFGLGLYGPVKQFLAPERRIVAFSGFTEQCILSEVLADRLQSAGQDCSRERMSWTIQILALKRDQIDCCVWYTGDIWSVLMGRKEFGTRQTVLAETSRFVQEKYGAVCLGSLGFENAYRLAMRRSQAEALGIRTITDLATHAPGLTVAGDLQFFNRVDWHNIRDSYGLRFKDIRPMEPTLMYEAIAASAVEVICAYSSDGRIQAYDLVLLEDPKKVFPPYDAVLLVSRGAVARPGFLEALRPLLGSINLQAMQRANAEVDLRGHVPRRAAELLRTWE